MFSMVVGWGTQLKFQRGIFDRSGKIITVFIVCYQCFDFISGGQGECESEISCAMALHRTGVEAADFYNMSTAKPCM